MINHSQSATIRLTVFLLLSHVVCSQAKLVDVQPTDGLRTVISNVSDAMDQVTPYQPTLLSDNGTTIISNPGNYRLTKSITGNIVINADNVTLDLNGYELLRTTDGDVIAVNGGTNKRNIKIHNGRVRSSGSTGDGMKINQDCALVQVKNVKVFDCDNGVYCLGAVSNMVVDCLICDCEFVSNQTGIHLEYTKRTLINDCIVYKSTNSYLLESSLYNCIERCSSLDGVGTSSTFGFYASDGNGNLFRKCIVKGMIVSGSLAAGFLLEDAEEDTKIINCLVNTVQISGGTSYGIYLSGSSVTKCFVVGNKVFNCENGIAGDTNAFKAAQANAAVKNVAFNNTNNYANVTNIQTYDPTSATDNSTLLANVNVT